jgi:hypothetical protein
VVAVVVVVVVAQSWVVARGGCEYESEDVLGGEEFVVAGDFCMKEVVVVSSLVGVW